MVRLRWSDNADRAWSEQRMPTPDRSFPVPQIAAVASWICLRHGTRLQSINKNAGARRDVDRNGILILVAQQCISQPNRDGERALRPARHET